MPVKEAKTVNITAKCSDMFGANLYDEQGNQIGEDYSGYVPKWFNQGGYGDYVELEIDIKTGQIVGWVQPNETQLAETFIKESGEDNG